MGNAQKVDELLRASYGTDLYYITVLWIIGLANKAWVNDYINRRIDYNELLRRFMLLGARLNE